MYFYVILICSVIPFSNGLPFPQGCRHGDKMYKDGSDVAMEDPCVKCRCARGMLVCRLRVCSAQPHPPPPGCLVLTRHTECCERLVCNHEITEANRGRLTDDLLDDRSESSGCIVNGTLYAEGSAMDSSTRCEYCYCLKGQQHCVKPQCLLTELDCTPSYTTDSCCPAKYNCSGSRNGTSTTTSKPTPGCDVDGRLYPEGELIPRKGSNCENCYCLKGVLHCEPVICSVPVNRQCVPVITAGHCCPTSYNCSGYRTLVSEHDEPSDDSQEDMIALNSQSVNINHHYVNSERSITGTIRSENNKDTLTETTQLTSLDTISPEEETTTILDTTTTITTGDESTTVEGETIETTAITTDTLPTTEGETTTILWTTSVTDFTDTEERFNSKTEEDLTSTTIRMDDLTTVTTSVANDSLTTTPTSVTTENNNKYNATSGPNKSLPSEIEAILNKTKLDNKNEDYDYDYNEPSLPPSLPNLRIIPFVAADAVVDDHQEPVFGASHEKSHSTDDPHFYEVSHASGFSPPAETEGGFVPKEPLLDGPFYESKYDSTFHTTAHKGSLPVDITSDTLSPLPPITEPPKTPEEEKCVNRGQSYRHGELLTEPSACTLCICFFGKILCQEPKCPVPDPGCHLLSERDHGSCCRKIACNAVESPTRVVEHATPAPHLPPFTVADVIVTPDPFRDVIRTEPAPDLSSLIGEIMPYLLDQSTSNIPTTPVSLTTVESVENNITTSATVLLPSVATTAPYTEIHPETTLLINENKDPSSESKPSTISTTTISTLSTIPFPNIFNPENEKKPQNENDYKEVKEEEMADDEFSFDSIFSYFLDGDKWTTEKSHYKTKKPSKLDKINNTLLLNSKTTNKTLDSKVNQNKELIDQSLEHRSGEDLNELSNLLNSTSNLEITKKTEVTTGQVYLDNKMSAEFDTTTKLIPVTQKPGDKIFHHTTIRNFLTKVSTKRYGVKYTSNHSRPLIAKPTPATHLPSLSVPDPGAASGLLKLAGCNIYGRMYRVGRIISELSGPCLECMCTEVGVQCRPLKC